jgi:hypothetical protein
MYESGQRSERPLVLIGARGQHRTGGADDLHIVSHTPVSGQKRQRVAPYGSAVATPKVVWKVKR